MKALGLYLHIPFCRSKCLYCDFCSRPHPDAETVERYVQMLCCELSSFEERCRDYTVDTVYFGGGTPTFLETAQLERLLACVCSHFSVASDAEITAECNPATADLFKLRAMRRAGWNRLSIGLQSAQATELRALGRLHDFSDFCEIWEAAVTAGFDNLSADVMFGIPMQTEDSFADTLQKLLSCRPQHLSAYALSVEEGTPFGRRGEANLHLPDEETVRRMYLGMIRLLRAHGTEQYEISNFAQRGYESRHNLKYWNAEEYLGFGPAAHSDFGGERFGNAPELAAYLAGNCPESERTRPDAAERTEEYVMLQMRLCHGLRAKEMTARFGAEATARYTDRLRRYKAGRFVKETADGVAFTPRGMLVSNTILSDILEL